MVVGSPDFKRTLIYGIDFKRTLIYGEGPRFPKSPNLRWGSGRPPPTVDWGSFARIVARMSPQRPLRPAGRKKQKEKRKEGRGRRRKKKKEDRTKKKGEEEEERKEERIYITTPDQPPHGGH